MSDRMNPIPFEQLLLSILREMRESGSVLSVPAVRPPLRPTPFCGGTLETPLGPAAGPHTQLAGNLAAAYAAGARVFELKTVQIIDGEDLPVEKPCIYVDGECYNVEWSTELTVTQASAEYVKAWILIHLLAREFDLGGADGFQFHMSVGYDLAGLRSEKVDRFIEEMKDASRSPVWADCIRTVKAHLSLFRKVTAADVDAIPTRLCDTVTLSTLHGCPVAEIENMVSYMLVEKDLNTFLKCNPTLIGYDLARRVLDENGYDYLSFGPEGFAHDLQPDYAVEMLRRQTELARAHGKILGVKLTNTFPVAICNRELPGETMYLSGKPLFLLAIRTARLLSDAFDGALPVSFSGGIDTHNIAAVLASGIAPVTVATLLLKNGGYRNLTRLAALVPEEIPARVDCAALGGLVAAVAEDPYYHKEKPRRKPARQVPDDPACYRCRNCVDVCPNRANVPLPALKRAVHIDDLCNECGNCACFCPFGYLPYRDKFTLFSSRAEMARSGNDGFCAEDGSVRYAGTVYTGAEAMEAIPETLRAVVEAIS